MSTALQQGTYPIASIEPCVLVDDPDQDVRELIVVLVTDCGFRPVVRGCAGEVALDQVDLIVVEPTSVSGRALLAEHARTAHSAPVVCVSIYPRELAQLPAPVFAYLMKPFSGKDLRGTIADALNWGRRKATSVNGHGHV